MTVLKITNFGGEIPRVSARALPDGAAQVSRNLLATSNEFRPMLGDTQLATTAPANSVTLYRTARDASGNLRTSDTDGWIATTSDRNYVKGQLNDDNTERTYLSYNDGTARMRVIDATGQDRILGVPVPLKPTCRVNATAQFTLSDAEAWMSGELVSKMKTAIETGIGQSKDSAVIPWVKYGLFDTAVMFDPTDTTTYCATTDTAQAIANGLNDPQINPSLWASNTQLAARIQARPVWNTLADLTALKTRLRAITNPKTGSQLFTDAQLTVIASDIHKQLFDPTDQSVASLMSQLDDALRTFSVNFAFRPSATISPSVTMPSQPAPPQFTYDTAGNATESANWVKYASDLKAYYDDQRKVAASATETDASKKARIAAVVAAQTKAANVVKQITDLSTTRRNNLTAWVKAYLESFGLTKSASNPNGLVEVDPDRIVDSRYYIATYVTDWGEESAPSTLDPATDRIELDQNDSVTVTVPSPPSGRNIAKWRLYRSNSGSSTTAFQFVDEMLISTLSYTDSLTGSQLGEVCPTVTWLEPPSRTDSTSGSLKGADPYLRGLVGIPNGSMAAFMDNFVAFCEPYIPYAWPVEYQITTEHPIVGLGVFGQSIFVGTLANPYIISGSDPASMSAIKLDVAQACASRRSIVSAENGVFYASPDGICYASPGGVQLITQELFSREDWQALEPKTIRAAFHEGVYYFWYKGNAGGCYALDTVAKKLVRQDMAATAVYSDQLTDAVFYVQGSYIKRAFSTSRRVGQWKSGKVVLPKHSAFAWLQVDGDISPAAPATIRWYADGALVYTASVTSTTPVRLPAGRYLEHEVEVESTARITKVMLASSTAELQAA